MSRVGRLPITIPSGVSAVIANSTITIKGLKGELSLPITKSIDVSIEDTQIIVTRKSDVKRDKQLHGTTRANIANMVTGVDKGFSKNLEIKGIGYRAALTNGELVMSLGYSHPIKIKPLTGVKIEVPNATEIVVSGIDKCAVGQQAALIRAARAPEPYKGKGIRYKDEVVRLKEGKKAGK